MEVRRARFFKDKPDATESEFEKWIAGLTDSKWHIENSVRQGILQSHGLACFTQDWENELFWAHYGRNHTGFCIGFDEDVLVQWAEVIAFSRVAYLKNSPVFRFFHEDPNEFVRKVIFSKSAYWTYEAEFRLLFESVGLKKLPPQAIVDATLGCRASAELRSEAKKLLSNSPVKIFEAIEIPARFELRRATIEPDVSRMTSHF